MRNLLILLVCSVSFGQQMGKVAETVIGFQNENLAFQKQSLFTLASDSNVDHSKIISKTTYATLDLNVLTTIMQNQPDLLQVEIPYQQEMIPVLLYKVQLHAENFHIDTDKSKNITPENSVHYRGIISGETNSLASFNFFNDQVNGIISGYRFGNLTIGKLIKPNNSNQYITYSDTDLLVQKNLECNAPKFLPDSFSEIQIQSTNLTQNCVTVYFEIDYHLYLANGSNLTQTTAWINSVFNNVQTLFTNDGIKTALKSVFIWTTPDPYSGTNVYQYLDGFHANRPLFDGDVGQLLTVGTNFGGVAAVVNGLCSPNNYLYSDVFVGFSEVPNYSWTVQSITHELGHIMGSPHTHDCVWNGDNTPIDGCGPAIGYPGLTVQYTTCSQIAPNPTNGGTIMSYCYAVNGVGNNFANGFGPQPAARIAQTVDTATCLGTDCITTCIASVGNLVVANISMTTVDLSWTDTNSSNSSWYVSAASYPFTPLAWTVVNTTSSHTFTNLAPNTYYRFFVRNDCGNLQSPAISTNYIATTDSYCDGKSFTDTGGLLNNYADYQDWIRVFSPTNSSNETIKVTFNSIDIEQGYDFLHIYDGPDTSETELVTGGITGNAIVGPFTSTHSSGALTFRFISDTNTNGSGWDATISCESLGIDKNDLIDFSYSPNPVKEKLYIRSKNPIKNITVFSIEGKLLYQSNKNNNENQIDFTNFAIGTYVIKLQFDNKPATFKIIKQ